MDLKEAVVADNVTDVIDVERMRLTDFSVFKDMVVAIVVKIQKSTCQMAKERCQK